MSEVANGTIPYQNGIYEGRRKSSSSRVACTCCPYGYHIDLDFVRFCEALNKEEPSASKKERRERRRQRRSMEVLLGLNEKTLWNFEQQLPSIPQEQNSSTPPPPPIRSSSLTQGNDGLKKAVLDFEATLERASKRRSRPDFLPLSDHDLFRNELPVYDQLTVSQESKNFDYHTPQDSFSGIDFDVLSICSIGSGINSKPLQSIREQMALSLEHMKELEEQVKQIPILQSQLASFKEEKRNLLLQLKSAENERRKLDKLVKINTQEQTRVRRSHSCSRTQDRDQPRHTRDIGILCAAITREVGLAPIRPHSKSVGTDPDKEILYISETNLRNYEDRKILKEVEEINICKNKNKENEMITKPLQKTKGTITELKMEDLDRESEKKKRISLKDLDIVLEIPPKETDKYSQSTQTVLQETPVLKVVEKRNTGTQIDESYRKRDVGISARPKTNDIAIENRPKCRDYGSSEDRTTDIVCDKCCNLKTRSIGVGLGNVKLTPTVENQFLQLGSQGRSKSFDFSNVVKPKPKLTRSIGISTFSLAQKVTSSKGTDTNEYGLNRYKQIGVNTVKKKLIDAAVGDSKHLNSEGVNLCDKCNNDIKVVAKGIINQNKDNKDNNQPSRIPRPKSLATTPVMERKKFSTTPVMERKKYVRQDTYTKIPPNIISLRDDDSMKTKPRLKTSLEKFDTTSTDEKLSEKFDVQLRLRPKSTSSNRDRHSLAGSIPEVSSQPDISGARGSLSSHLNESHSSERLSSHFDDGSFDYDEHYDDMDSKRSSQAFPDCSVFQPIQDMPRKKLEPSKEMKGAMKVINDSLHKYPGSLPKHLKNASNIIQEEWFKMSSTASANPLDVEDYLDSFEEVSSILLEFIVNMTDNNGNTAMHYAVSHGNFDVVSILLDSKVCNINTANAAGYTCIMLVSLAQVRSETHKQVVKRLFQLSDVNIRAKQHGQTALMLAVSHGRLDMVQLLLEAGADPNIQDEDGSTALMCAAEHGHLEIVKHILNHPDCDPSIVDYDGSSALAIAMEAGNRDIGVLLYAKEHFSNSRGSSPYTSQRQRRSKTSPSPAGTPTSPAPKRPEHPF